jgi:putative CocE/NonD family hydrolase
MPGKVQFPQSSPYLPRFEPAGARYSGTVPFVARVDLTPKSRVLKHVSIPMRDGVRLAARIWLPEGADSQPVPAIFEYIPYRKNDVYAEGDEQRYRYLAAHGYAGIRVDLRGTGDSEGQFIDEYSSLEQLDGVDVIAWIAAQPWCTGKVGMIGLSWGGFNALQIAALAPPALAAIIVMGFSDDRYADDVHYIGGCLLARYQMSWATTVLGYMARPPDPVSVGDRWKAMWLDRLNRATPLIEPWLMHQHYDGYWKHGSVCENYGAIKCPVFAVGGWLDGYTNSVFRMLEHFPGVCKGLVGPWGHQNPYCGVPGPAIGWLQESLRWWDHWLKGVDTGILDEPKLRFYRQDALSPGTRPSVREGKWASQATWPSANVLPQMLRLGVGTLGVPYRGAEKLEHKGKLVPAVDAGNWTGFGQTTDLAEDQRAEDRQALVFDGSALDQPLEILGCPTARLAVIVDQPQAFLALRLCDVAPDGFSTLITRGFFNLTHHRSREMPVALQRGEAMEVTVVLKVISYVVPPGHHLRLGISTNYWPWIWPSPDMVSLAVRVGGDSTLTLPVRQTPATETPAPAHFSQPEAASGLGIEIHHQPVGGRTITWDAARGRQHIVDSPTFFSSARLPDHGGIEFADQQTDEFEISEGDPLSATIRCTRVLKIGRNEWRTRIEVTSTMTSSHNSFLVTTTLEAYESNDRVHAKTWTHTIPRLAV